MHYRISLEKVNRSTMLVRLFGLLFAAVIAWNLLWTVQHINFGSPSTILFSLLFLCALVLTNIGAFLNIYNNWHYRSVRPRKFAGPVAPEVAVIIPTCGEPVDIIMRTINSVFGQRWRSDRLAIIIGDDAHSTELQMRVSTWSRKHPDARVIYFTPPKKGDPRRNGAAKAGNLNAALDLVLERFPHIAYVETRDADDLVGTKDFLGYCIGHLEHNPETSFVQTIKECTTDPGDPFSNNESVFYRTIMPARDAVNAAFPCGSGLVWRISELVRIGGFPVWNLVEDLQSGFEILSNGGVGAYLPIVGAVAQTAPEDMANFYKQRGTWALDSLRLFFWRNPLLRKGLNMRQKAQFLELECSYLLSFCTAIFIVGLAGSLVLRLQPVVDTPAESMIHFGIFVGAMELYNFAKARGIPYRTQRRARQVWLGLMPVFMVAAAQAIWHGPNRKPSYKVTRKYATVGWYWKETIVQSAVVAVLLGSIAYSLAVDIQNLYMNLAAILWSLLFAIEFSHTVRNSWHGIDTGKTVSEFFGRSPERKGLTAAQ
jgi:cellulose synthase (UDP-forming)